MNEDSIVLYRGIIIFVKEIQRLYDATGPSAHGQLERVDRFLLEEKEKFEFTSF